MNPLSRPSESYPAQLRQSLHNSRTRGLDFEQAWQLALTEARAPVNQEWHPLLKFLQQHFRSAYHRDDSKRGRCRIAEPDTVTTPVRRSEYVRPVDAPRCLSGDGCDRPATTGRFGKRWCAIHGAELARLSILQGEGLNDQRKAS